MMCQLNSSCKHKIKPKIEPYFNLQLFNSARQSKELKFKAHEKAESEIIWISYSKHAKHL
jgi:hypothetical protein